MKRLFIVQEKGMGSVFVRVLQRSTAAHVDIHIRGNLV